MVIQSASCFQLIITQPSQKVISVIILPNTLCVWVFSITTLSGKGHNPSLCSMNDSLVLRVLGLRPSFSFSQFSGVDLRIICFIPSTPQARISVCACSRKKRGPSNPPHSFRNTASHQTRGKHTESQQSAGLQTRDRSKLPFQYTPLRFPLYGIYTLKVYKGIP